MARPQQQQVQAREVVQTLEDQHKYAMPDDRRLYVKADPIWIQTTPAESTLTQFAQSLAQVKPEIMNWAVDRQAKIYGEEINQGQQAAREGKVPSNPTEHMQWGYDATQSVNDATSWTTAVQQDYEQNFDKENGDIEKFLQDHYAKSPAAGKSDIYQTNFYKQADRAAQGLRAAAAKDKLTILDDKVNAAVVDLTYGDIVLNAQKEIPWTLAEYEARRADARRLFPGKTNKELDDLVYKAAHRYATETFKPEILDVFKEQHSDGTPGLASKNWEQIKQDQKAIVSALKERQTADHKQASDTLAAKRNTVMLEMLKDPEMMKDEGRMRATYLEIATQHPDLFPPEDLIKDINTELGYLKSITARVESPKEELKALEVQSKIGQYTPNQIVDLVHQGEISPAKGSVLLSKLEEDKRHKQAMAKQDASNGLATRTFFVGQGHQLIQDAVKVPAMTNTLKQTQAKPLWERNQYLATIEFNDWVAGQTKGVTGDQINAKAVEIAEKYKHLSETGKVGIIKVDQEVISPYIPQKQDKPIKK